MAFWGGDINWWSLVLGIIYNVPSQSRASLPAGQGQEEGQKRAKQQGLHLPLWEVLPELPSPVHAHQDKTQREGM